MIYWPTSHIQARLSSGTCSASSDRQVHVCIPSCARCLPQRGLPSPRMEGMAPRDNVRKPPIPPPARMATPLSDTPAQSTCMCNFTSIPHLGIEISSIPIWDVHLSWTTCIKCLHIVTSGQAHATHPPLIKTDTYTCIPTSGRSIMDLVELLLI